MIDKSKGDSESKLIRVDACKYDNSVHRSWSCSLLEETAEMWIFLGVFKTEIKHQLLGTIEPGTLSVEYYWKNRWYNVFKFYNPDRVFRCFYCNINTPPALIKNVLSYVDLDIDVLVQPNLSYQILDLDEFQLHAQTYNYPLNVIQTARQSLNEVIELIEHKQFPFDSTILTKEFIAHFPAH